MAILIKGMEMPKTCIDCPLHDGEYGQCNINHNIYISFDDRPRKCPLTEINSHYLIDANLPSIEPERKKGKWDMVEYEYPPHYKLLTCSVCGERLFSTDIPKFCQFCGSLMEDE